MCCAFAHVCTPFEMIFPRLRLPTKTTLLYAFVLLLTVANFPGHVSAAKKATNGGGSSASAPAADALPDPVIEEVTQKQLERILAEKEYVAVYWCKSSCFLLAIVLQHQQQKQTTQKPTTE